jgi:hypothetical protein
VSSELASYGGGVSAGQGPFGFEPPVSPTTAELQPNTMTTNMHGYLGLASDNDEQPQSAAPAEHAAVPGAAPDPGALESLLLRFGLVSSDQLGEALREQAETGRPVGAIVVERGWVSAGDVERLAGNPVEVAPAVSAPAPALPPVFEAAPAPFPAVPAFDELPEPPSPVFHVVEPVVVEPVVVEPVAVAEPDFQAAREAPLAVAPVLPEPEPERVPELPPMAPIVPFQGFTPMDDPDADSAPEPEPAALALPEPVVVVPLVAPAALPFQAPADPEPAAPYVPFSAESAPTPPAVPLSPVPAAQAPYAPPDQPSVKHLVIARLTTGERVEINSYADRNAARAEAKALMAYLREGHPDWPFVNGRFIRPEAIVSIDLETVLLS